MNEIHMRRSRPTIPPLSALRAFEAAVRLGTFKAAAEDLRLTQSAISHQIAALEAHYGARLFTREGNRVVLTKDGALYGNSVLKAFSELARAGDVFLHRKSRDIVRVSASPSFATFAALPRLEAFKLANKSLDLRIEARNTNVDFETESIDAAIQVGNPPFRGLKAHRLFRSRLAPLAHPALCKEYAPLRTARHLARMPLIELNNFPGMWESWFAKTDPKIKLKELTLSSDSLLAAIQMAESGIGVVLAPFPLTASAVTSGRLKAIFRPSFPMDENDFYLVYRKEEVNSLKIKVIQKWLKEVIADLEQTTGTDDL